MNYPLPVKRLSICLLLVVGLTFSAFPANSAVKMGDVCKILGQVSTLNGYKYTCIKSGSKIVWSKGVKDASYDAAFAKAYLAEAQSEAARILADAKSKANQMTSPPNCNTSNSRAFASIGGDASTGLKALVFKNSGICDLIVRASASFLCPDGKTLKVSNAVTSTGTFPLKAGEELLVSYNIQRYFPQVFADCRLLTGYTTNTITIDTYHQSPNVITLSSKYGPVFNQAEATKKANQYLISEKKRAAKIVADAMNPTLILKAWKIAVEAKAAAAKIESDKAAQDAGLGKKCVPGTSCLIGSTGPGGGVVFYDAGSQQSWGRYLELAPKNWNGVVERAYDGNDETQATWCSDKHADGRVDENLIGKVFRGEEIGAGKANTEAMLLGCSSKTGAAALVRAYRGGGLSDWYLPSRLELNELCKYATRQKTGNPKVRFNQDADGGLRQDFYPGSLWSSTEYDLGYALAQVIGNGNQYATSKDNFNIVRPIRSF
jgi:hypothetical protein